MLGDIIRLQNRERFLRLNSQTHSDSLDRHYASTLHTHTHNLSPNNSAALGMNSSKQISESSPNMVPWHRRNVYRKIPLIK